MRAGKKDAIPAPRPHSPTDWGEVVQSTPDIEQLNQQIADLSKKPLHNKAVEWRVLAELSHRKLRWCADRGDGVLVRADLESGFQDSSAPLRAPCSSSGTPRSLASTRRGRGASYRSSNPEPGTGSETEPRRGTGPTAGAVFAAEARVPHGFAQPLQRSHHTRSNETKTNGQRSEIPDYEFQDTTRAIEQVSRVYQVQLGLMFKTTSVRNPERKGPRGYQEL